MAQHLPAVGDEPLAGEATVVYIIGADGTVLLPTLVHATNPALGAALLESAAQPVHSCTPSRRTGHRHQRAAAETASAVPCTLVFGMKSPSENRAVAPVRCDWCLKDPLYIRYHDLEWGVPKRDDRFLFEMLVLEGAQAGLSWFTILKKREAYRAAFSGFDPEEIARYDARKVEALLADPGIVRNRLKVQAAIVNARAYLTLLEREGELHHLLWSFVDGKPRHNAWTALSQVPARTPESDAMSKALVARGFKFVGSTICYALMQSAGMVNDHLTQCFRHTELQRPS